MNDEPNVGEWATVIQQHCDRQEVIGDVVKVLAIHQCEGMCLRCVCRGTYSHDEPHALMENRNAYHPLKWLKRLPPPQAVIRHDIEHNYDKDLAEMERAIEG